MKINSIGNSLPNLTFGKVCVKEGFINRIDSFAANNNVDPDAVYACVKTLNQISEGEDLQMVGSYIGKCKNNDNTRIASFSLYHNGDSYSGKNKIASASIESKGVFNNKDLIGAMIEMVQKYNAYALKSQNENELVGQFVDEYVKTAKCSSETDKKHTLDEFKA